MKARGPTKPLTAEDKGRMYDDELMFHEGIEDDDATPPVNIDDNELLQRGMREWVREQEANYRWREEQLVKNQQELGMPDPDDTDDDLFKAEDTDGEEEDEETTDG